MPSQAYDPEDVRRLRTYVPKSLYPASRDAMKAFFAVEVPLEALAFLRLNKRPIPHLSRGLSAEERMRLVRSYPLPFDPIELIIWDDDEISIADGQHRLTVARERGDRSIPVEFTLAKKFRPNPSAVTDGVAIRCRGCQATIMPGRSAWLSDHFGGWFCSKACDMEARRRSRHRPRGALVPAESQVRHGVDLHRRPSRVANPRRNAVCPACGARDAYVSPFSGQIDCRCAKVDLAEAFERAERASDAHDDAAFMRWATIWAHRLYGSVKDGEAAIAEAQRDEGSRLDGLRVMVFG